MGSSAFNKYPETFDFGGKKVLNIGCGFSRYRAKNVVNLDSESCSNADVVWDLSKTPLPFENNTFDFIFANHILEHVPNWWDCFEDCARILKPGGKMEVWVPGPGNDSVLGFRDHLNSINQCSWWGTWGLYRAPNNAWAQANSGGNAAHMKILHQNIMMEKKWWIRHAPKALQAWIANHLRNVVYEIGWVFEKTAKKQEIVNLDPSIMEAMI